MTTTTPVLKHPINKQLFEVEGAAVVYIREGRIGKDERHPNLYYYDMRHGENNWAKPVTLEKTVWIDFFGTLVTTTPIKKLESPSVDNSWVYIEIEEESQLLEDIYIELTR